MTSEHGAWHVATSPDDFHCSVDDDDVDVDVDVDDDGGGGGGGGGEVDHAENVLTARTPVHTKSVS